MLSKRSALPCSGDDGHIAVYNHRRRQLLARSRFPAGGAALIWLSAEVGHPGHQMGTAVTGSQGCCVKFTIVQKANPALIIKATFSSFDG